MQKQALQPLLGLQRFFFTHAFLSGSVITVVCSSLTLISVSCLHFGQSSGKFSSTVSGRSFIRVLLPQTGHNRNSTLHKCFHLLLAHISNELFIFFAQQSCDCKSKPNHSGYTRCILVTHRPLKNKAKQHYCNSKTNFLHNQTSISEHFEDIVYQWVQLTISVHIK